MKKHLVLTQEQVIGNEVVNLEYKFVVDVSNEILKDMNELVFNKHPEKLFKCEFQDLKL
jgi:hypothetical protein